MNSKNDLYDEFGNYLGEDLESDEEEGEDSADENSKEESDESRSEHSSENERSVNRDDEDDEDNDDDDDEEEKEKKRKKKTKEDLSELQRTFEGAEIFIEEEDTQDIDEPTINKINTYVERISFINKLDAEANRKNFDLIETTFPNNKFDFTYLTKVMFQKEFIRNICVAGHFHHGKTTVLDRLIESSRDDKIRRKSRLDKEKNNTKNSATASFYSLQTEKEMIEIKTSEMNSKIKRNPYNSKKSYALSNYTDTRLDEQARGLSIKAIPVSLLFQNRMYEDFPNNILLHKKDRNKKYKSYLFNIMDTPGHVNFFDEFLSGLNICDVCCLVVDVVEGCMYVTEQIIKACIYENVKIVLLVNCIDKLIMHLRLPPNDAYHKINFTIEEINSKIEEICKSLKKSKQERKQFLLSPLKNNVIFASSLYGMFFTLKSFSRIYCSIHKKYDIDIDEFSQYLWGDVYFNEEDFTFSATPLFSGQKRTFIDFILNPVYKIFGYVCSEEHDFLIPFLKKLRITLQKKDFLFTSKHLLKKILTMLFQSTTSLVDVFIDHGPSPLENARNKIEKVYLGSLKSSICQDMNLCKSGEETDNLMIYIVKNYHRPETISFDLFGRVFCGTIRKGQTIRILGEGYNVMDNEDMITRVVTHLWIYEGRYRVEVNEVPAGNFVLIGGVDLCISKTCTLTIPPLRMNNSNGTAMDDEKENEEEEVEIFCPLNKKFQYIQCTNPVFKIACEPINPSELPKMLEGLRKIDKAYPFSSTKVEESGEHVILGTGELYLDCILHDLRKLYGDLEIKVSDPVVQFNETIQETSSMNCFAETPNKKNKLYVIAEPMESGLMQDIDRGFIRMRRKEDVQIIEEENKNENKEENNYEKRESENMDIPQNIEEKSIDEQNKNISGLELRAEELLRNKYKWDSLAIKSFWSFGPENNSPNILLNDTLPSETNQEYLNDIKDYIIQGFCWAAKEGPLIEEQMKNVKIKILKAEIDDNPIHRGAGQIIPTVRRAIYSAFLLGNPKLLEPILFAEIICSGDSVPSVYNVLSRRRGQVLKDYPKVGTPLYIVNAYLPAIESFGFETDLRIHTSGQAFCLTMFDHWYIVPGDPLDKSIVLRPLEPAPIQHLSREFLLKTRRRKGLTEDVSISRFFDEPMLDGIKGEFSEFF